MLKFQRPVTPAEISRPLAELCSELVPGTTPFYIDVFPLNGAPANECFPLVRRQVEAEGGELVIGWSLWELPSLFVEAEFMRCGEIRQTNSSTSRLKNRRPNVFCF